MSSMPVVHSTPLCKRVTSKVQYDTMMIKRGKGCPTGKTSCSGYLLRPTLLSLSRRPSHCIGEGPGRGGRDYRLEKIKYHQHHQQQRCSSLSLSRLLPPDGSRGFERPALAHLADDSSSAAACLRLSRGSTFSLLFVLRLAAVLGKRKNQGFLMGNCLAGSSYVNEVSSTAKPPETPPPPPPKMKIQTPWERDRSEDEKLPSNSVEVEAFLRRGSSPSARKLNPLVAFSFEELRKVANDFRRDAQIGGGGFGRVYKGCFGSLPVAVKVHDGDNSFQGHREWLAEVIFLGQLSHPNLVKLVGYCCEGAAHRVLVYEYMPLGSVESHLFSSRMTTSPAAALPWAARMRIALGAARGLAFLHGRDVIYRDFKTSNILLDAAFTAKLSDFGLAKDGPVGEASHVSTRVMGTYGYAAPEYMMTGHLTAASDVYSYGVVLLELLTGRRSLDRSRPPREQVLTDWAVPALPHKKRVMGILDPRLLAGDGGGDADAPPPARAVHKTAMLAYHCLSRNPKARPLMRDVVASLEPLQVPPEEPDGAAA